MNLIDILWTFYTYKVVTLFFDVIDNVESDDIQLWVIWIVLS